MIKKLKFVLLAIAILVSSILGPSVSATTSTFGYTTKGTNYWNVGYVIYGEIWRGSPGIATSISVYCKRSSGTTSKYALYKVSDGSFVAGSPESTWVYVGEGWETWSFSTPATIEDVDYYICVWRKKYANYLVWHVSDSSTDIWGQTVTYGAWPSTYSPSIVYADRKFSMYCTYTVAEGPTNLLNVDSVIKVNVKTLDGVTYGPVKSLDGIQ